MAHIRSPLRAAFGCLLLLAHVPPMLASSSAALDDGAGASTDMNTGIDIDTIDRHLSLFFNKNSHFQSPFSTKTLETVPCGGIVETYPQSMIGEAFDAFVDAIAPDPAYAVGLKFLFANNKTYGVQVMKVCASCDSVVAAGAEAGAQDLYENPSFDHYCGENAYGHDLEHSGLVYLPLVGTDVRPGTMPGYVYSRPSKVGKLEKGPSGDLDTSIDYAFGLMATMAMGTISFAPDYMGYGAESAAERGYLLRDTYLTSSLPLWLWVSNFVTESTDSRSALGDAAFYIGASEGGFASVALAEGFRAALGVEPVHTFASAGPYRMGTATLLQTIISVDAGVNLERFAWVAVLLGAAYSSTNPNAANFGQEQDLLNDEHRDLALSWLNNPDFDKYDINTAIIAHHEQINGVDAEYKIETLWNRRLVNFLRDSIDAGVDDPCNPDYEGHIIGENDKFCEVLKQNDLIDVLENSNYEIELCHSQEDTLVTYSNMPDVSVNTFLTANIKTGDHEESVASCFFDGFADIVSEKFLSFVPEPKHKSDCVDSPYKAKMKMAGDNSVILLPCEAIDVSLGATFCKRDGKLATHCPMSCGTCKREMGVDSKAQFQVSVTGGKLRDCEWLRKLTKAKRKKRCANESLKMTCRATCNY